MALNSVCFHIILHQCWMSCTHYTIAYQNFHATDNNQSLTHLWYGVLEHRKGLACWRGWCSFSPQKVRLISRISDTPASTKSINIIQFTEHSIECCSFWFLKHLDIVHTHLTGCCVFFKVSWRYNPGFCILRYDNVLLGKQSLMFWRNTSRTNFILVTNLMHWLLFNS